MLGTLLTKEKLADLIVAFCGESKEIRTLTFPSRKELSATYKKQIVLKLTIEQEQQRLDFKMKNPKAKSIPRGAVLQNEEIARQADIDPRDLASTIRSAVKHMQEYDDKKLDGIVDKSMEILKKFSNMQMRRSRRELKDKSEVGQRKKIQTFKKPKLSEPEDD